MPKAKTLRPVKAFGCTNAKYQLTGHAKPKNDGDMEPVVIVPAEMFRLTKAERAVVEAACWLERSHQHKDYWEAAQALKKAVESLERAKGRK